VSSGTTRHGEQRCGAGQGGGRQRAPVRHREHRRGRVPHCALSATGRIDCWGENYYGELGNNSTTDSNVPVQVEGVGGSGLLSGIAGIAGGYYYTCALSATGRIDCWARTATSAREQLDHEQPRPRRSQRLLSRLAGRLPNWLPESAQVPAGGGRWLDVPSSRDRALPAVRRHRDLLADAVSSSILATVSASAGCPRKWIKLTAIHPIYLEW